MFFMNRRKVGKNACLKFSVDFVCVLEGFGKTGKRDDYIFLGAP